MLSWLFGTTDFMTMISTPRFWYTIAILIGLVVLLINCIKHWGNGGGYALLGIFTIGFISLTCFSLVNLNVYYEEKGGIHGAINGIFDTNQIEVVEEMKFKFTYTELVQQGETDKYSATITMPEVFNLEKDLSYMVYVNDMPCYFVENASDYVKANYGYVFYDENENLLMKDTLNFSFAFYTNSTTLKVSTNGGSEAVKYWNYFFNKNIFIVKIVQVDEIEDLNINFGSGDTSNYCVLTYMFENEPLYLQVYKKGSEVILPPCNETKFNVWTLNGSKLQNGFAVNEDLVIQGELSQIVVTFKANNSVYKTVYETGTHLTETISNPKKTGYDFVGWSIDGKNTIDIYNYEMNSDVTYIALFGRYENVGLKDNQPYMLTFDSCNTSAGYLFTMTSSEATKFATTFKNKYDINPNELSNLTFRFKFKYTWWDEGGIEYVATKLYTNMQTAQNSISRGQATLVYTNNQLHLIFKYKPPTFSDGSDYNGYLTESPQLYTIVEFESLEIYRISQ